MGRKYSLYPIDSMRHEVTAESRTTKQESKIEIAFILSMVGGTLIVLGSVTAIGLASIGRSFFGGMEGMMVNYPNNLMRGYYYGNPGYYGMIYTIESIGIIAGVLVIVFAIMMKSKPVDQNIYGSLVIATSLIGLSGMGSFVGVIIGVTGGVLALLKYN